MTQLDASALSAVQGAPANRSQERASSVPALRTPALETPALPLKTALAFGWSGLFGAAMTVVIAVYLSKFYVDVALVPAGVLALAMAIGRALDAVVDPFIGYLSDHTRTRWGRRKPWICAGVLGNAVCFYLLLTPPASLSAAGATWWYGLSFLGSFFFAATSYVPRQALGVELTLEPRARQRLYGLAAAFLALGTMLGAALPTVLKTRFLLSPRLQMATIAEVFVIGYVVFNALFVLIARERREFVGRGEVPFVAGVRRALRSRPFRVMFASHVITAIPLAMPALLLPFFVQYVLRLEPLKWTGLYLLAYFVSGFVALPFWTALARRRGKRFVWLVLSFVSSTGIGATYFMGPGDAYPMLALELYLGLPSAAWLFVGGALHADVVDYDELHTGKRREAQFSALWAIIPKFAIIPGAALPLAVLGSVGYVPNAATQPEAVVDMLRVLHALVPAAFNALGLSLMIWYPLSEARHLAVREGVARHARGLEALDPLTGVQLAPPTMRDVDEQTAWFLDTFSVRELEALLEGGRTMRALVTAKLSLFTLLLVAAIAFVVSRVERLDVDPGPLPALAIVVGGFALAGVVFHLLRVRPATSLDQHGPERAVIERHLAAVRVHTAVA